MSGLFKRFFLDAPRTVASPFRSAAAWSSMVWASSKGPLLVELRNLPFGEGRAATEVAVLAALSRPVTSHPLTFTTDPESAPAPEFRAVVAFHPCVNLTPSALARGQLRTLEKAGRLTLMVVFTSGNDVLASVEGRMEGVSSIAQPGFATLLHQAMRDLFGGP